jgi:hypothetical protein
MTGDTMLAVWLLSVPAAFVMATRVAYLFARDEAPGQIHDATNRGFAVQIGVLLGLLGPVTVGVMLVVMLARGRDVPGRVGRFFSRLLFPQS